MNNRKIFFILFFLLSTLFVGLEIVPKWGEKPFSQGVLLPNANISEEEAKQLLKEACLSCHSIKYNDAFSYTKSDYAEVEKRYNVLPMDLSLISKVYTKEYVSAFLQDPKQVNSQSAKPHEELKKENLQAVVAYLFEDKNQRERERIGIYILGFIALFSLLIYLKMLIQRPEHPLT